MFGNKQESNENNEIKEIKKSKEDKSFLGKVLEVNRKSDEWWRKFVVVVWIAALLYVLYIGIVWLFGKIGL